MSHDRARPRTRQACAPTRIGIVGTHPPTACGIATFTSNVAAAITSDPDWEVGVVRLVEHAEVELSAGVVAHWAADDPSSLERVVDVLNAFDGVVLQHEYGIFPGPDGDAVLDLIDALSVPVIAVLHTVLAEPSSHQREVLERLLAVAASAIVQSHAARDRMIALHGVDPSRVVVIPHGAAANFGGPALELPRPCVLTWGLLSPGKGIEHGIAAVAALEAHSPAASYVIAGQTHPKVRAVHGEDYREQLRELASDLGAADRVRFDDGYHDWTSLRTLVRSSDVVLLPYESRDQVSSGVLVEAIASARPVVATRFPHAEELLEDGAGVLVDHGDVGGMASALRRVLYEPGLAPEMASAARRAAQPLLWPAVGAAYRRVIARARREQAVA